MKRYKYLSISGLTVLLNFGVLAIVAVSLTRCESSSEATTTAKIIPVKALTVGLSDEAKHRNYVGTAQESFALSLNFAVGGTVEQVLASEGQKVNKGQLLAVLSNSTTQNSYNMSQSTLKQAQDAYNRIEMLYKKGSLPEIKFVEMETDLAKAKAMEAISRKSLEDCKIYAPFTGMIAKRHIEEGQDAMMSTPAFKIVSIDDIDVKVSVPESEIGSIRTGQSATVTVSALDNKQYTGVVNMKGIEANSISHTYDITIRVTNSQSELMPGMVCKVFLQNGGENRKIAIPNKAVQSTPDGQRFVWLADDTIASRRFITIGSLTDYGVTVETGLSEGDKVITEGYNKISEGMKISIIQ